MTRLSKSYYLSRDYIKYYESISHHNTPYRFFGLIFSALHYSKSTVTIVKKIPADLLTHVFTIFSGDISNSDRLCAFNLYNIFTQSLSRYFFTSIIIFNPKINSIIIKNYIIINKNIVLHINIFFVV